MSYKTSYLILFISLIFCAGCGQAEREQKLATREKQVMEQQQELILKANELALKEAKLQQLAKSLDSASFNEDSLYKEFPQLLGKWDVNMVCSLATCKGSAVGDTKTEQWTFSLVGASVMAQAYAKNVLSRVYIGKYHNGLLQMNAQSGDSTMDGGAQIIVSLNQSNDSLSMEGKRSIIRPDCQIIYNLSLKKR